MELANETSKLIARAIDILKEFKEKREDDVKHLRDVIRILEIALDKCVDEM